MKLTKILASLAVVLFATTAFAATTADIIFVVDESGSMGGEHAWLGAMVGSLDADLVAAGVTGNRYGLVGFGASTPDAHQINVGGGQFGTAAQFATATGSLVTFGGLEDGYDGINFGLGYALRPNAAVNVILVTDEDRDVHDASDTLASVLATLNRTDALLNVVVNATYQDGTQTTALGIDSAGNAYLEDGLGGYTTSPGGVAVSGFDNTITDYVNPALSIGGAAWDLNQLRAGGDTAASFTEAFVDIKVGEIKDQEATPEPGTLVLLGGGLGLIGLVSARRRRNREAT